LELPAALILICWPKFRRLYKGGEEGRILGRREKKVTQDTKPALHNFTDKVLQLRN